MTQPTDLDLAEVLNDVRTVRDSLRLELPILLIVASDGGWPDGLLDDVGMALARGIQRLDAAAGLLTADD